MIVCGNIAGQFSEIVQIKLKDNMCTKFNYCNSNNNIRRSVFIGGIVLATLLGGIIGVCITIFIIITIQRKRKAQAHSTACKQESPDCLYEDVSHKQSSSVVIDTKKNVAYSQVAL